MARRLLSGHEPGEPRQSLRLKRLIRFCKPRLESLREVEYHVGCCAWLSGPCGGSKGGTAIR